MNKHSVTVSVVVPVYNVERYIRDSLDSIIGQTFENIEIILIDDCSTDNSFAICNEYASKDARIVLSQNSTNMGVGLTRNKGIDLAKGEYIGFVDPDDWIDRDFFEKLYYATKKNNAEIAKAVRINVLPCGKYKKQINTNRFINNELKKGHPLFLSFRHEHTTAIYKASIFRMYNTYYSEIKNAEDSIFLLRYTYHTKSIELIKNTHYYYRQHESSVSYNKGIQYFESVLEYFRSFLLFINANEIDKEYYNIIFSRVLASVLKRFPENQNSNLPEGFDKRFLTEVFNIMLTYKYDPSYLVSLIDPGVSRKLKLISKIDGVINTIVK